MTFYIMGYLYFFVRTNTYLAKNAKSAIFSSKYVYIIFIIKAYFNDTIALQNNVYKTEKKLSPTAEKLTLFLYIIIIKRCESFYKEGL